MDDIINSETVRVLLRKTYNDNIRLREFVHNKYSCVLSDDIVAAVRELIIGKGEPCVTIVRLRFSYRRSCVNIEKEIGINRNKINYEILSIKKDIVRYLTYHLDEKTLRLKKRSEYISNIPMSNCLRNVLVRYDFKIVKDLEFVTMEDCLEKYCMNHITASEMFKILEEYRD